MKKLLLSTGIFLLLFMSLATAQQGVLYDDFSTGLLNTRLWDEYVRGISEHFVNTTSEVYHTAQLTPGDNEVALTIKQYRFQPGDKVEFDLFYKSGSGNQISYIDINGNTKGWGVVGYWGGLQQGGNVPGKYHFSIEFKVDAVDIFITQPNGTVHKVYQFPQQLGINQTLGFGTRTGHDGITHRDYDNIYITLNQTNTANLLVKGKPNIGERINISLKDPQNPNTQYLLLMSQGTTPGITLADGRVIPLNPDSLFFTSFLYPTQIGLFKSQLTLNSLGEEEAYFDIPNIPALAGIEIYLSFFTFDPNQSLPQSVLSISPSTKITLTNGGTGASSLANWKF